MENTPVHEEIYKGYTIKIFPDDSPESPRVWDNISKIFCLHGSYNIGDKHNYRSSSFDSWDEFRKQIEQDYHVVPNTMQQIRMYDHSGIGLAIGNKVYTYPYNCQWDSGWVGWIFATYDDVKKCMGWKRITAKRKKQLDDIIVGEFNTYNSYVQGEVYGFLVFTPEDDEDAIDSCWGYVGDIDYCIQEAKSVVDACVKKDLEERYRKLKLMIRNKVPLFARKTILGGI